MVAHKGVKAPAEHAVRICKATSDASHMLRQMSDRGWTVVEGTVEAATNGAGGYLVSFWAIPPGKGAV